MFVSKCIHHSRIERNTIAWIWQNCIAHMKEKLDWCLWSQFLSRHGFDTNFCGCLISNYLLSFGSCKLPDIRIDYLKKINRKISVLLWLYFRRMRMEKMLRISLSFLLLFLGSSLFISSWLLSRWQLIRSSFVTVLTVKKTMELINGISCHEN